VKPASLKDIRLRGGFHIAEIEFTHEPMTDALGRDATAQTRIVGNEFRMLIRAGLSDSDLSVTVYHEILEAASVASLHPPATVLDFNEGDFESAAKRMHDELGEATPATVDAMLQSFGFREH